MADLLTKIQPNKIRNYWDIQRQVIGCIDLDKYNIDDDELIAIYEAIQYGIKMAHNHGYEWGYQSARRKQIEDTFSE